MTHPLINWWAIKKYGLPEGTEVLIEHEEGYGGGCEICGFGGSESGLFLRIKKPGEHAWTTLDTFYESSMPEIMNEILEYATGDW